MRTRHEIKGAHSAPYSTVVNCILEGKSCAIFWKWLLGMCVGGLVGAAFGDSGALIGAGLAALLVWILLTRLHEPKVLEQKSLQRIEALERNVLQLNARIQQLENALNVPAEAPLTAETRVQNSVDLAYHSAVATPPPVETAQTITPPAPPSTQIITPPPAQAAHPPIRPQIRESAAPTQSPVIKAAALLDAQNLSPFWTKLFSGNILAKIGVVLLFFGVASALKLAVEHGFFPIQVRLLLGAVAAVAMIMFGWSRAQTPKHQMFGFALQGGGFAILYLIVYFMLARYAMLTPTWAFIAYTLLSVSCTLFAAKQDSLSLAVLGISGAFLSPVLASSGSGDHVTLFSYFALLNVFVFALNWFKSWRQLNIVGFLFTLVIGMNWAMRDYQPAHLNSMEFFLVLFFLMYSLEPIFYALFRQVIAMQWGDGLLLFGVPAIAVAAQAELMRPYEYGLAWSVFIAGLYYLGLWWVLYRQKNEALKLAERSHLSIAVALLTYAVPLAFGAQVTSAVWTVEGAAVLWLGIRQERYLARWTGIALQVLAGGYFLAHLDQLSHIHAVFNNVYLGSFITAMAGMASGLMLHRWEKKTDQVAADSLFYWGLAWLIVPSCLEIQTFTPIDYQDASWLGFIAVVVLLLEVLGKRENWIALRQMIWLLFIAIGAIAADAISRKHHVLHGGLIGLFPAAVGLYYWQLARQERDEFNVGLPALHLWMFWGLGALTAHEIAWGAQQLSPNTDLWHWLAYGGSFAAITLATLSAQRRHLYPIANQYGDYAIMGLLPVVFASIGWFALACVQYSGDGSGLPYIPVLNPLDLVMLLILYSIHRWVKAPQPSELKPKIAYALPAGAFLMMSTLAGRLAHHWGGVAFDWDVLLHSYLMHALLSIIWTLTSIVLMIYASRRQARRIWFIGFGLLALVGVKLMAIDLANQGTITWTASLIGIAVLVIAASYFSPAPPKKVEDA